MKKLRISQQQIARDLGVSQTLVSMVLNGRRHGVAADSYKQIWEHARKKGYRPKGMAPEFLETKGAASSVGFILRTGAKLYSQSPFFGHVQHGLHDQLAEEGVSLVFFGMEDDLDATRLKDLYGKPDSFRGLVVLGEVSRPFLHSLKKLEPRIVTVSAQHPGLCHSVVANEEQAAEQLVQHLVDLGHRSFAWIGGNQGMQRPASRRAALESALRLRNLSLSPEFSCDMPDGDRLQGRMAAERMLGKLPKADLPTAWIVFNGMMARGAINFMLQQGIKIPRDISVAAFDRTRLCEEELPTLTGASADPDEIGRVAGEMILKNSEMPNGRYSDVVLASELIARESTGRHSTRSAKA